MEGSFQAHWIDSRAWKSLININLKKYQLNIQKFHDFQTYLEVF